MRIHTVDMKDFSHAPFGRFADDGVDNGTAFREKFLLDPMLDPLVDKVTVLLDSVDPGYEYGSSFLEEAFGGLVRVNGLSASMVHDKLEVVTVNSDYAMEIMSYIEEAAQ